MYNSHGCVEMDDSDKIKQIMNQDVPLVDSKATNIDTVLKRATRQRNALLDLLVSKSLITQVEADS